MLENISRDPVLLLVYVHVGLRPGWGAQTSKAKDLVSNRGFTSLASSNCWLQSNHSSPLQGHYPCSRFSSVSSSFWPRLATALRSWRRLPFGGDLALGTPPVHPARTKQVPPVRVVPAGQPPKATPKGPKKRKVRYFAIGIRGSFERGAGQRPTGWAVVGKDHTYTHTPWRCGTRERSRRCRRFRC